MIKTCIIVIIFLLGLLFCMRYSHSDLVEGFASKGQCPNLLVQKGNEIHLIYTNKARIPGVNPVKFKNLEEYVEFLDWQRAKGIHCPVLYFQETYDAQNNKGYRMLPDLVEKQGGLPTAPRTASEQPLFDANRDDMPFNQNSYPAFDAQDQYVGAYTPLDKIFKSNEPVSASPMDVNWGGKKFSEKQVLEGKYNQDMRFTKFEKPIPIPAVSTEENIDNELTNIQKQTDIVKPSKQTQRNIASRYGGEIMNSPENRAMIAAQRTEYSQ